MIHKTIKINGTYSYYGFGEKYYELIKEVEYEKNSLGCEKNLARGTEEITEQNNKSIKNNKSTNNTEEYYKPLNAEENFELIWQIYPKQENKSSAFKEYCLAFKRYKDNGYEDTQINRMFWHCVKEYAEQVEKEKREIKYIKNGSNFLKNIEDYIKPIKEYK